MGPGSVEPQRGVTQPAPSSSRDGFRPFTPPSHNDISRSPVSAPAAHGGSGTYWNRTAPSSVAPRANGSSPGNYGGGSSSRPQLDMRQPIVRSPAYGGYPSGGSRVPSYSAPRGTPSYGGSHSAPSNGGGGGHVSAPSGGGGHSSGGGGGGHSSGGGGAGHSSGGHR